MYATDGEIDGQAAPIWYLLDIQSGESREISELRGYAAMPGSGEPIIRETVPFVGDFPNINQTDQTDTFVWTAFDLTIGKVRADIALKTVGRSVVDSPDHSVVAGFDPETPTRREGTGVDERWSVRTDGSIVVVDGKTSATYTKPLPDVGTEWVMPTLVLSPDGEYVAFSAYGDEEESPAHRTWVTSREPGTPWVEIGPYMLYDWIAPARRNEAIAPAEVAPATPAANATPAADTAAVDAGGRMLLGGELVVLDARTATVVEIPLPDIPATVTEISPSLVISPDGRFVAFSATWEDAEGHHTSAWITATDGKGEWVPVGNGTVLEWYGS